MQYSTHFLCLKIVFNIHLLFKLNEKFCILSGNLILGVFCFDCTLGSRDLILLPVCGFVSQVIFPWQNFCSLLFYRVFRSLFSHVFLSWHVFLAPQSLPWLYLYLGYLNHQFPFFLRFSWDAKRIQISRDPVLWMQIHQEPLGDINVWSGAGAIHR